MNKAKNKFINKLKSEENLKLNKKIINIFNKYKMYLFCILVIVLSIISVVIQSIDKKSSMQINSNEIKGKDDKIAVYITGAVKNPGVYYLEENSRLSNLLDICGGINENADIEQINLAKKLVDSDKITIPVKQIKSEESESATETNEKSNIKVEEVTKEAKVNINVASKEELMQLNGIGDSTATKIIEYRKVQRFIEIEDIMNVSGIGESKYEKIKDYITVD